MPLSATTATKIRNAGQLQVLFKKDFHTTDYLYAESPSNRKKANKVSGIAQAAEGHVRDSDYDNEERMLSSMEKVYSVNGQTIVSDEFWTSFKRFVSQLVAAKRQSSSELSQKVAKLKNYRELENLESRIAELQSHRIELIRELAQDEKSFADSFRLKSKVQNVLEQTVEWSRVTKEVYNHIFMEKQAADLLRQGLTRINRGWTRATASAEANASAHAEVFQEGKVVYRVSRMIQDRYCVITIYAHDLGRTEFRDEGPYAKPTFSTSVQGDTDDGRVGTAVLMTKLMTEELPGVGRKHRSSSVPVYLVVVYDVITKKYFMLEHQPKDLGNRQGDVEQAVIKHVNAHLTLATQENGTLVAEMPGAKMPLRQVWANKREIEGDRPGLFHISIYELDAKTWLMRVHDNSLCKMYSHVVPKDLLNDHEDLADADDKEDWVTDPIRVSVALERLRFEGCVLSIQKRSRGNSRLPKVGAAQKTNNAKDLHSVQSNAMWPSELVVNVAHRLGKNRKYMLIRASAAPAQDLLGIIVYEPIEQLLFEQVMCFSELCFNHAQVEKKRGDTKGLEPVWRKMGKTAKQLQDKSVNTPEDSSDSDGAKSRTSRRTARKASRVEARLTAFGVSSPEYTRAVTELLEAIQLVEEDGAMSFHIDPTKTPASPQHVPLPDQVLRKTERKTLPNIESDAPDSDALGEYQTSNYASGISTP